MYSEADVEDYLYHSASWWSPKMGPFNCDNLIHRFECNGFPGITAAEIRAAHARLVERGTLLDNGSF